VKTLCCRSLIALILAFGTLPVLVAQVPDWYATHKNIRYPSDVYIIGVGAGTGTNATESAIKAAQTDVVSQIRVQIQAEVKNVSESFQFNKDEQLFSDFRSNVRTAVSDEITGLEIAETVTDNSSGTVYTLAVLEREKYCETLRNEMDSGWKQANDLQTGAFEFAKQGKLNDAILNLMETRKVISPLLPKQALYNAVSGTPYKSDISFGPASITTDIRKILSGVKMSKKGGDNQKGKIGESFPEPFVVQVTIQQDGKSVPVVGSTIVFETSDNVKIGDATTDDQGTASLSATIRTMTGNGIRARLSVAHLDRDFDQNLLSSAVNFTWKAEGSNVSFTLKVTANSSKVSADLKRMFTTAITQIGYKVVSSSKYVIAITVEPGTSSTVEGMAGALYSQSADVIANLLDKTNDTALGSVKFSGKGLARTEDEAIEKAVGNVKISMTDLSDLLQKATEK
jgi:hypothetical protein